MGQNVAVSLHPQKCKLLSYCNEDSLIKFNYRINNCDIPNVDSTSELGVLFSYNLNFARHISDTCNKARSSSIAIRRCFRSKDPQLLYRAFTTYTMPILEYCSLVWCPFKQFEI